MNYTLHQLQVFLKVTQTLNITKAAEELHLTQPAVSIQIKNLQDQFEIPILEIVGRKVFITDFGKEIAEAAQRISQEIMAINSKAAAFKGQLIGQLKITVVSTGKYVIPYFLSEFMKNHRGIDLVLDVTNRARVIESLERNEIDFALVSVMPENLKVENIELMENELFMVGSKERKIETTTETLFSQVPVIFREQGSGTRSIMEKYIKNSNIKVAKKMELTSNEAVKQAVIADLGISIMPLIGIRKELKEGEIKILPMSGFPIKSPWRLVWLKRKSLSPVANAYIGYVETEKSRIIQERFQA